MPRVAQRPCAIRSRGNNGPAATKHQVTSTNGKVSVGMPSGSSAADTPAYTTAVPIVPNSA